MIDRRILIGVSLLSVAALSQSCSDTVAAPVLATDFVATLSGANERPTPNASTATGSATVSITDNSLTFNITVAGLTSITAAHIHVGKASVSGGILVNLSPAAPPTGTFSGILNSGTITAADLANAPITLSSLAALIRNGDTYINVHTVANAPGEIRGQLVAK